MREIKFRAWDIDNEVFLKPTEILIRAFNGAILRWDKSLLFNVEIQQFTGLKDKNAKDIYEGDIYHQGDKNILYKVIFQAGCFIGNQIGNESLAGLSHFIKDIEVIGNVFENPDLIN